jgi:signal transduction histidine kinase
MLAATLSFAREEGQQEATRELDLVSLLESLCDDYADMGQPVICLAEGKQVYACRANTLRRVLQNLIGNAIKYAGGAEVSLVRTESELLILVCDRGPGIAEGQLEEVFKPFVRLDEARNTESGSVGLGLAIARTLVHQHGGELSLHNRPEGGLEARISLPL